MQRTDSFEKTLMLGKIEGRRRRERQRYGGWMASPTQWTWVWVDSRSCWWTGRPDMLQFMGSQRIRHNWTTELNWTRLVITFFSRTTVVRGILQARILKWVSSVHFSHSVTSDSLWPHGLQDARPPCPTPTLEAYSNSCPSSRWGHPTISSSVIPFSSHLQSLAASGSFQMSQFFTSGGQSIGVSASASVLPINIQDWFPLGWTGWISLVSKGLSRVFSNTTVQKHQFFGAQLSLWSNSHIYTWLLEKP